MATRTRKATTPKTPTPKKTAARNTTPRPRLSLADTTTESLDPTPTPVDLRHPLTARRRLFTGPMGVNEQAAIRAALDAAASRLPIPVRSWNGSTTQLADGTLLIHNPSPDRIFTAHIACRHGAIHNHPITTYTDLREARALTHACERPHTPPTTNPDGTPLNWDKAITRGVHRAPAPKPPAVLQLREGVRRAHAATAETQPLSKDDIAAGLTARAATDTPKEHPQP